MSNKARRTDRAWDREWLPLLIAPTFALAALLPVLFDVMKDIRPSYDCGEGASADHDENGCVLPSRLRGPPRTRAAVVSGVRATHAVRIAGSLREQSALCWVLFVLTAGHALVVSQHGHGPYFC